MPNGATQWPTGNVCCVLAYMLNYIRFRYKTMLGANMHRATFMYLTAQQLTSVSSCLPFLRVSHLPKSSTDLSTKEWYNTLKLQNWFDFPQGSTLIMRYYYLLFIPILSSNICSCHLLILCTICLFSFVRRCVWAAVSSINPPATNLLVFSVLTHLHSVSHSLNWAQHVTPEIHLGRGFGALKQERSKQEQPCMLCQRLW